MSFFPKIVVGHNNIFGVDHLNKDRGKKRSKFFNSKKKIERLIDISIIYGAQGMMLSTHQKAGEVLDILKKKKLYIYPLLPYLQKYITEANNKGLIGSLKFFMTQRKRTNLIDFKDINNFINGIVTLNDINFLKILINQELINFKKLNCHCIFLHDGLTDICLALNLKEIFYFYNEYILKEFKTEAGYATKNFPLLIKKFNLWGLKKPKIMSHINDIGFNMNPSMKEYEKTIKNNNFNFMAMSSLASGATTPSKSYRYIGKLKKIESICVGVSSEKHVKETFSAIKKFI